MPWLYWSLKPKNRLWADEWQKEYQEYLMQMETIEIRGFKSQVRHICS